MIADRGKRTGLEAKATKRGERRCKALLALMVGGAVALGCQKNDTETSGSYLQPGAGGTAAGSPGAAAGAGGAAATGTPGAMTNGGADNEGMGTGTGTTTPGTGTDTTTPSESDNNND